MWSEAVQPMKIPLLSAPVLSLASGIALGTAMLVCWSVIQTEITEKPLGGLQ